LGDVWVYWSCNACENLSLVRNLSIGGLYLETSAIPPLGLRANLDFLVQEGQIRAEAAVRHVESSRGIGLKFTSVVEADRPNLAALMTRLRSLSK
jgi:hypothetical protein